MIKNNYKITNSELDAVLMSSAAALPDSPHERGMGARAIKKTFSEPLRLLTSYINAKLDALREELLGAPDSFYAILGENISGLYLWLDGLYASPSEKGLINLVSPSECYEMGEITEGGSAVYVTHGAELPVRSEGGELSVSVSCKAKAFPACLFTLAESNLFYVSVYKISDTVCRVLYKYPQLAARQSYDFSVGEGEITHITAVKKEDSIAIYSHGNLMCAVSLPFFEPSVLGIGMDNSATPYGIFVRSLRIFERALSPSEVTDEYAAYKQREDNYANKISHVLNLSLNLNTPIREIFERAVKDIRIEMDKDSFTLSFMPMSLDGRELLAEPHKIDLPLEEMIMDGEYVDTDEHPTSIKLSLRSGNSVFIPVGELVKGLTHSKDFSVLEGRVGENQQEISRIRENAFFSAAFDSERKEISFYSEESGSPVNKINLDLITSDPYQISEGAAIYCKSVPNIAHMVRVSHKRRNKILSASDLRGATGEISTVSNVMHFEGTENARFKIICNDMADRELYTLSFSCDGYTGEFSVSVYDSAPVTVAKGGRTSVSFIYDKSKFGGAVPVCDSVRTANSAELYNFTVLKGTEKIYVPVSLLNNSITLHSCGKNLLNPLAFAAAPVEGGESIYEGNSLTLVSKSSDCYTSIYYEPIKIPVNPNEEITFSWEINSGAPTGMVYIFGNGTTESMTSALASEGQLTYKVPEGISFITYRVGVAGIGNRITYSNLQIERGSVPTEYEPYIQGESVSLALDEVAFLTPISPCMNIYTHDSIGVCQGEFLKSGALIKATELIFADPDHKVNSHITSATAEYSQADGKIRLNLFNDSKLITNVDMTDAIQSFVVKEILGGLI